MCLRKICTGEQSAFLEGLSSLTEGRDHRAGEHEQRARKENLYKAETSLDNYGDEAWGLCEDAYRPLPELHAQYGPEYSRERESKNERRA